MPDIARLQRWAAAQGSQSGPKLFAREFAADTIREQITGGQYAPDIGRGFDSGGGVFVMIPRGYKREDFHDLPDEAPNGIPIRYEFAEETPEKPKIRYTIEINPRVPGAISPSRPWSDEQYRAVLGTLGSRGYPGGPLRAVGDDDWEYGTPKEIDHGTITLLKKIPGVKVQQR